LGRLISDDCYRLNTNLILDGKEPFIQELTLSQKVLLLYINRKIFGGYYKKKISDVISLSQFKESGLLKETSIKKNLKELKDKKLIESTKTIKGMRYKLNYNLFYRSPNDTPSRQTTTHYIERSNSNNEDYKNFADLLVYISDKTSSTGVKKIKRLIIKR